MAATAEKQLLYANRYRAIRQLSIQEARWHTELGVDLIDSKNVVIKTYHKEQNAIRRDFESRVTTLLRTPEVENLCPLHWEERSDHLIVITPFASGQNLTEYRSSHRITFHEVITLAISLLKPLKALHAANLLHGNLKPSNIIISENGNSLKATLIDSAIIMHRGTRVSEQDREDLRYLAPEAAGLIDYDESPASDFYTLGLILHEFLSGRPVFDGSSVGEILRQNVNLMPERLRRFGYMIPSAIDQLINRLVRKNPHERYQTASGILYDVRLIEEQIHQGNADPRIPLTRRDRRLRLTTPSFTGRDEELRTLTQSLYQAERGHPQLVTLRGESGSGKSCLIQELHFIAEQRGSIVLHTLAESQVAQRPFQILDPLVNQFLMYAEDHPTFARQVKDNLDRYKQVLPTILPQMNEFFGEEGTQHNGEAVAHQSISAIEAFINSLGTPITPCVIIFDDCQWADLMSLRLLKGWLQRQGSSRRRKCHLLLIVAFREDELRPDSPLNTFSAHLNINLKPLSNLEIQFLVESMAGPLPIPAIQTIQQLARGNPFFASAALQGLVECGALIADPTGWYTDKDKLANFHASKQGAEVLTRRLDILPAPIKNLLTIGAIIGGTFSRESLEAISQATSEEVTTAIKESYKRSLIWEKRPGVFAFVHSKIRESLLASMNPEEKKDLHWRTARHMIHTQEEYVFDIAYHLNAAGHPERAVPFALEAAKQARLRGSLDIALAQYEIAHKAPPTAVEPARQKIAEGLGEVLMLTGAYDAAETQFQIATSLAKSSLDRARLALKMGELYLKRSDLTQAESMLMDGLTSLGIRANHPAFPRRLSRVLTTITSAWRQLICTAKPKPHQAAKPEEVLATQLFAKLADVWSSTHGASASYWARNQELWRAFRSHDHHLLGEAYSHYAESLIHFGKLDMALRFAEEGLSRQQQLNHPMGEGQGLYALGLVHLALGNYKTALQLSRDSQIQLEKTGDRWRIHQSAILEGFALLKLGDLQKAAKIARTLSGEGLQRRDGHMLGSSINLLAKATLGEIKPEVLNQVLGLVKHDPLVSVMVGEAYALCFLRRRQYHEAVDAASKAVEMATKNDIHNIYITSLHVWLTTCLRLQISSYTAFDLPKYDSIVNQWRERANLSHTTCICHPMFHTHALRERAYVHLFDGSESESKQDLEKSLRMAEEQGERFEMMINHLTMGEFSQIFGWKGADKHLAQYESLVDELKVKPLEKEDGAIRPHGMTSVSVAQRLDSLLQTGSRIASSLSREEIYRNVCAGALELLRGEDCAIIKSSSHLVGSSRVIAGQLRTRHSEEIVNQTLSERRRITWSPTTNQEHMPLADRSRSILCMPLNDNGKTDKCFYTTHSQIDNFFGDDEGHLAEFIAALAAAALENASGFSKIQELSRKLESDILQRQKAEGQLQASLKEKEILLKEVYHRTKNNMQIVSSLLNLQSKQLTDQEQIEIFRECQFRIRSMSLVHEKLYRSGSLADVNFRDYIRTLAEGLLRSFRSKHANIELEFDLDEITLNVDTAIPSGLVVNELITNSMKYGFPHGQGGKIFIQLRRVPPGDDQRLDPLIKLSIADTGIGIDPSISLDSVDSLGLKLVRGLVQNQLQGKVEIIRDQGTRFEVTFRELKYASRL